MSELTRRTLLNLVTGTGKTVGILALTFFSTPLLLRLIGASDFGTFKVLFEVLTYLNLLEMGVYGSLISALLPAIQRNDAAEIQALLREGLRKYLWVILFATAVGLGLMPFLTYFTSWEQDSTRPLFVTFGIMLLNSLFIPTHTFRAYLEASNRGYVAHLIVWFQNTLFILASLSFAALGFKLEAQALGLVLSGCVAMILMAKASGVKVPISFRRSEEHAAKISANQRSQVLNELAGKVSFHCDNLLIAVFAGPVTVTKVFLGQRVVQILQGQLTGLGQAAWASLSSLYYSDAGGEAFKLRFLEMTKVLVVMAVILLVPVCILNESFLRLWVGEEHMLPGNTLVYVAAVNALFFPLFGFFSFIFTVLGKPKEITRIEWAQALVNISASLALTSYLGGVGPIAGTLVSFLVVSLVRYPWLIQRHFGISSLALYRTILAPALAGIGTVFCWDRFAVSLPITDWASFFLCAAGVGGASAAVFYLLLFTRAEKELFRSRLSKVLRR